MMTPDENIVKLTLDENFANLARADCIHDFEGLGARPEEAANVAFQSGLKGNSTYVWNEPKTLELTLRLKRDQWDAEPPPPPVEVYPHKSLVTLKKHDFLTGEIRTGSALADELGINNAVLCIDFNHHGFLAKLKKGDEKTRETRATVGYVYSAATVNDPASKTPPGDDVFKPGFSGVNLICYEQTSGAVTYVGNKEFDQNMPTQNFISKHDVTLSGITEKKSFGKRAAKTVSITFAEGAKIVTVSDSKSQNSPGQLNSFIARLKALFSDKANKANDNDKTKFELSTKWQQKRSGDWLQAIHAVTLDSMTFNPPLPAGKRVFFVSHDQIAIAYALRLKLNCLYFSGDYIYTFTFGGEVTPTEREAQCATTLSAPGINSEYRRIDTWWTNINTNLNVLLSEQSAHITKAIDALASAKDKRLAYIDNLLHNILVSAVLHSYIKSLLPNLPTNSEGLTNCQKLTRYYTLKALMAKHKDDTFIPPSVTDKFKKQSAIYKSANDWKILPTESITSRLFAMVTRPAVGDNLAVKDNRDNFLFFPFLQTSLDSNEKSRIVAAFKTLQADLTDSVLLSKIEATPRNQAVLFKKAALSLQTFFAQAFIFLKEADQDGNAGADLVTHMSTSPGVDDVSASTPDPADTLLNKERAKSSLHNPLDIPDVVLTKQTLQQENDGVLEQETSQTGGWAAGARTTQLVVVDHDQVSVPILYAMIDCWSNLGWLQSLPGSGVRRRAAFASEELQEDTYSGKAVRGVVKGVNTLKGFIPGFSGGNPLRRSLYGGVNSVTVTQQVSAQPEVAQSAITAADVVYICILLTAGRITRDSWKLAGAPPDVFEYYFKGASLLNLLVDIEKTDVAAEAVRELTTQCIFMTDEDIATAFSIDVSTAAVYRMFFSALEEHPLITRPENPAQFLRASSPVFTRMWNAIGAMPENTSDETIRALSESVTQKITRHYGLKQFPGVGKVLEPGAIAPTTPEELREARARFAEKTRRATGGKRIHRTRRSTTP